MSAVSTPDNAAVHTGAAPEARKLAQFARLLAIMERLRVECPWDREQTMLSLRNQTIEECFELTDAIVDGEPTAIKKELGDLLLHVVFYSKIATEQGWFDIGDVAEAISEKLIFRHPHIFGDVQVSGAQEVIQNWEALKKREKDGNRTTLSGVPRGMPALPKACRIQQKAAGVGFDWRSPGDVWAKVQEEVGEVQHEIDTKDHDRLEAEFGDLLFAIVNAARLYGVNSDLALERTNLEFIRRFEHMERVSARPLNDLTLEEMDELWEEAKKQ